MKSDLHTDTDIKELEDQLNRIIQPLISDKKRFFSIEETKSQHRSLAKELWITLNGGGEVILGMHKALANPPAQKKKSHKSLQTFLAIYTPFYRTHLIQNIDMLSAPFDAEEFSLLWVKQAYSLWKDKLAGLYLIDANWQNSVLETPAKDLGRLKGRDWIAILNVYLKEKSVTLDKLSS